MKSKIDQYYEQHDCQRISQGDILRDFKFVISGKTGVQIEILFQYIIVLTQDCDLEQGSKVSNILEDSQTGLKKVNQYLHNILFVPAFPAELLKKGEHLQGLYKIQTEPLASKLWQKIVKNSDYRYHFLPSCPDYQVPDLLIDFKAYYTLAFDYFLERYHKHYLVTVNELFRESLSQRFAYYLSRIGLPELLEKEKAIE